ncbi:hypothetical protein [Nocardia sp. NPDC050406]|uniref:hypothetical protein n=1 Tax=Nocardia sp. NPDC050406 TaxID=3364318 RepID=UPI0037AFF261
MRAFEPNDYRKRVLAAVERRGGIEHSDAFELYDIPLDEAGTLTDGEVEARIQEVWGFWQKQRDHPKYRVLVGLLVDGHDELSHPLRSSASRRVEADRVRQLRSRRDAERFEMLDTAIERLVNRHGGIPAGKIPGLEDIGKLSGLDAADIAARLRRHRIIDESPTATPEPARGVSAQRRQQIRQLLAEYDRLLPGEPVPTLLALLGLEYSSARQASEIHLRAEALRARTRELPPGRVRVVLDELLVHVRELLEPGGQVVEDYLKAIAEDVADLLRPQVRAAVLVEDQLVEADYRYLVGEAITAGLDYSTAQQVIIGLATELGSTVEGVDASGASGGAAHGGSWQGSGRATQGGGYSSSGHSGAAHGYSGSTSGTHSGSASGTGRAGTSHTGPSGYQTSSHTSPARAHQNSRAWEEPLKSARAALRSGHPREAARHVENARHYAASDPAGTTSVRPVAEEVERLLAEAAVRWRSATAACAAKRYIEALDHLQFLERSASDVPNPQSGGPDLSQLLAQARSAIAEADRLLAAAPAGPLDTRLRAMRAILDLCADHTGARAALNAVPLDPPGPLTATRKPNGTVTLTWTPSATSGVEYKVTRQGPDNTWRVVGRTRTTELEDGGAPPGPLPVYAVVATLSGRSSEQTRTDVPPPPASSPRSDATTPGHHAAAPSSAGRIDMTRPARGSRASTPAATPATSAAIPPSTDPESTGSATGNDMGRTGTQGGGINMTRPPRGSHTATPSTTSPVAAPPTYATPAPPQAASTSPASAGNATPSGMPTVENLAATGGLLTFDWPPGITEVMVVARTDSPPVAPDDPDARAWKVTNTRYQLDGGVRIPADIFTPCHIAVASCRRAPSGMLTVAEGFAPAARMRWEGLA